MRLHQKFKTLLFFNLSQSIIIPSRSSKVINEAERTVAALLRHGADGSKLDSAGKDKLKKFLSKRV